MITPEGDCPSTFSGKAGCVPTDTLVEKLKEFGKKKTSNSKASITLARIV